jgi:hypothetical protein
MRAGADHPAARSAQARQPRINVDAHGCGTDRRSPRFSPHPVGTTRVGTIGVAALIPPGGPWYERMPRRTPAHQGRPRSPRSPGRRRPHVHPLWFLVRAANQSCTRSAVFGFTGRPRTASRPQWFSVRVGRVHPESYVTPTGVADSARHSRTTLQGSSEPQRSKAPGLLAHRRPPCRLLRCLGYSGALATPAPRPLRNRSRRDLETFG